MMTVKQLIGQLQECDPDDVVILSKDEEGNGFSPLAELGDGVYVPDSTWSGEVHLRELTPELIEQGYTDEDVRTVGEDGAMKCVTLWPTN